MGLVFLLCSSAKSVFIQQSEIKFTGTVRRIQYTFNNTNDKGYQPPPCFIDWPEGTLTGKVQWVIGHCPNMVCMFLEQNKIKLNSFSFSFTTFLSLRKTMGHVAS